MTALLDFDLAHGQTVLQRFADLIATTPEFVGVLGDAEQRDFTSVLREVTDLSTVGLVFFVGREHLRTGEGKDQQITRRSRGVLVEWAKGSRPTAVWTLAGMIAATSVSLLERFFRRAGARLESVEVGKVNPRGGKYFDGWLRTLERLGCVPDAPVVHVLRNLIAERNEFIHGSSLPPDRIGDDYIERAAVAMSAWPNAVALCARSFLEALASRHGVA